MSDFELNIRRMENELTALKTAHERGLGAVDFYSKTVSASGGYQYGIAIATITATVADGELSPAFCQIQITFAGGFFVSLYSFSQSGRNIVWKYEATFSATSGTATATARVVSASKLASLSMGVSWI